MNKNISLKFHIIDILIIAISIIMSVVLMIVILLTNNPYSKKRYVEIYHNNMCLEQYRIDLDTLDKPLEIVLKKDNYPRLLGDFTIYIDPKKGIKVENVTCPNHTCVKQGWVNITNLPVLCLPNDVRVVITTSSSNGNEVIGDNYYEKEIN